MLQIAIYLSSYAQEEGETVSLKSNNIYFVLNLPGFNLYFISKWFSLYFYKNILYMITSCFVHLQNSQNPFSWKPCLNTSSHPQPLLYWCLFFPILHFILINLLSK